jgi:hypothetical protein
VFQINLAKAAWQQEIRSRLGLGVAAAVAVFYQTVSWYSRVVLLVCALPEAAPNCPKSSGSEQIQRRALSSSPASCAIAIRNRFICRFFSKFAESVNSIIYNIASFRS